MANTTVHRCGVSHLLLDIEGTTCPVSFVADTLFPYADRELKPFLQQQADNPTVQLLLLQAERGWNDDADPEARALHQGGTATLADYLSLLIRQDRKLPALKELQGLIWEHGYAIGELLSPLYPDVPPALERWSRQGLTLAVYSSGSVRAQQLLYHYSQSGDLRGHFEAWFDTRTGPKQDSDSYIAIAGALGAAPERILFISDALTECQAAQAAGLQVLFSDRDGNPKRHPGSHDAIRDYSDLVLEPYQAC